MFGNNSNSFNLDSAMYGEGIPAIERFSINGRFRKMPLGHNEFFLREIFPRKITSKTKTKFKAKKENNILAAFFSQAKFFRKSGIEYI
ncbi:MAG: hypothetical protein V1824_02425 [archaeon]